MELFFVVNFFEGAVEIQIQTHKSQLFLLQQFLIFISTALRLIYIMIYIYFCFIIIVK